MHLQEFAFESQLLCTKRETIKPEACPKQPSKLYGMSASPGRWQFVVAHRLVDAHLPGDEVEEKEDLLRQRQHQGPKGGDVGLEGVAGDGHELLGQENAHLPLCVLLLEDTAVAGVTAAHVGADHVEQLIPTGPSSVSDKFRCYMAESTSSDEPVDWHKQQLPLVLIQCSNTKSREHRKKGGAPVHKCQHVIGGVYGYCSQGVTVGKATHR